LIVFRDGWLRPPLQQATLQIPFDGLADLFDAAPIVFVRLREPDWERSLEELGIGWTLAVDDVWELRAVRD
jgi:hypothetical protein